MKSGAGLRSLARTEGSSSGFRCIPHQKSPPRANTTRSQSHPLTPGSPPSFLRPRRGPEDVKGAQGHEPPATHIQKTKGVTMSLREAHSPFPGQSP